MKFFALLASVLLLATSAAAQWETKVGLVGVPANLQLDWTTRTGYNYQVMTTPDLMLGWTDTGIVEPGTGSPITYGFSTTSERIFYRIVETPDPHNGSFLLLPTQAQELTVADGVRFGFDLDGFSQLPSQIRLYQRLHGSSGPWTLLGTISDFTERGGVKFPRGSAVWLADTPGEYDVQAVVVDSNGHVIASATRLVIVSANPAPSIVITGGPASPSASYIYNPAFTTEVSAAPGTTVWRVEFFDNGVYIGHDTTAPFGDVLSGPLSVPIPTAPLARGTHAITAKAYDTRGGIGETAVPYTVEITGGPAAVELTLISPQQNAVIVRGQPLVINYIASHPDGPEHINSVWAHDVADYNTVSDTAPFESLTMDTTGWSLGTHKILLMADNTEWHSNHPLYFDVYIQDAGGPTFAEALAANIADPASVTVSNALFTGAQASSSLFTGGLASGLQLDEGVIMTSGRAQLWNYGNFYTDAWEYVLQLTIPDTVEPGNVVIDALVTPYPSYDAAGLEFDVYCAEGQLELEYQFGSEEYLEYVGTKNDAIAVTIDGVLVSLLPTGLDTVSVNSIHAYREGWGTENVHLYLDNDTEIKPTLPVENQSTRVEYNGMVVRLKIHAFVTPGQTHHVHIAIADVDDYELDSGLFIGRGSLRNIPVAID